MKKIVKNEKNVANMKQINEQYCLTVKKNIVNRRLCNLAWKMLYIYVGCFEN